MLTSWFDRAEKGHVVASSAVQNRREWAIRRQLPGPLNDKRGARGRARDLRDLARVDPGAVAADLAALRADLGEQPGLW